MIRRSDNFMQVKLGGNLEQVAGSRPDRFDEDLTFSSAFTGFRRLSYLIYEAVVRLRCSLHSLGN